MGNTLLSVLVCSYNNAEQLTRCLQAIRNSNHPNYELVVVDDGSSDHSHQVALQYADKAVKLDRNRGRSHARNTSASLAKGDVFVFIDSDVCIRADSLNIVESHFKSHPEIVALTGLLSKEHFNPDFFSQYKNLYMNYIFHRLPQYVTFLYGSIHAVLRHAFLPYGDTVKIADDTALGQKLLANGGIIGFVRELEVVHLKKYTAAGFFKNDFVIPYDMARIFIKFRGWKQLGRNNTGFVHASPSQLLSVVFSITIVAWCLLWIALPWMYIPVIILLLCWFFLNLRFFYFLFGEKGLLFVLKSVAITFIDNLVMASGIIAGFLAGSFSSSRSPRQS